MLTSTCLALKTMPCAPSPMRPKMQYCSMALSPFPGTGSFRVTPPPRSRPRRGCLATARKLAPGPGGRGQLGIVSGHLSAFP